MKVETLRDQVRTVADRWANVYGRGSYRQDKIDILAKLRTLDVETATAEDVAAIIGNGSWVCQRRCHECNIDTYDAVELGEPPDYESATATICRSCLVAALDLLSRTPPTKD